MRLSDFCERRSTRSLAQVLSKAAAVYLDEVAGDDAQNAADDDAAGGGSDALSADDGGTFDGTALDDDDDALLGFGDGDVGGDEMAVDELDGDFSLQSAGFQESLNQLAMQKRWAAKEQELRDAAEREKARGRRGVNLEPAQKNSDKVQVRARAAGRWQIVHRSWPLANRASLLTLARSRTDDFLCLWLERRADQRPAAHYEERARARLFGRADRRQYLQLARQAVQL